MVGEKRMPEKMLLISASEEAVLVEHGSLPP